MVISYNWLSEYLPQEIPVDELSKILTSIGLEVESVDLRESIPGGLRGLVTGTIISCEKHPNADKLHITTVDTGDGLPRQIVCGAANVAAGQKVIVALPGTTIYPTQGDPITIKNAKIRGIDSSGMICAEDEIGLGTSHDGIMILSEDTTPGIPAAKLFNISSDHIFEIGLTPNRMDAMSHLGVARDVTAYLSYHKKEALTIKNPYLDNSLNPQVGNIISVDIENKTSCRRYCGVHISGIKVSESPDWLKIKLNAIGVKPINNIVDITNFILHESGQPLHAFDADRIKGSKIIVRNATEGEHFITLDQKERKLYSTDLVIADIQEPMCIAGVYGGYGSGVSGETKNIFLESAWFEPEFIRKTSLKHGLRTDAATRFEKGVDISNSRNVLVRAATLIAEICNGVIDGNIVDEFDNYDNREVISLSFKFLEKLSGKKYSSGDVLSILTSLNFEIIEQTHDHISVKAPYSKPDIHIAADLVEEIMRIDGLDNIQIPQVIRIAPSVSSHAEKTRLKEKISDYLTGLGYNEIFTNSITNSAYYPDEILKRSVKMINSLSSELDIMRPSLLETGLEVIAHNLNRKNSNLQFFEFGKTYHSESSHFKETTMLSLFATGKTAPVQWNTKEQNLDFFGIKGILTSVLKVIGLSNITFSSADTDYMELSSSVHAGKKILGRLGKPAPSKLQAFGIKENVFYAELYWDEILSLKGSFDLKFKEIPKYPVVDRDLALVVDRNISFSEIENLAKKNNIAQLTEMRLFDVYQGEKIGEGKKSMAVSFRFLDEAKTLTDKEIDDIMQKLISSYTKEIGAEIRK